MFDIAAPDTVQPTQITIDRIISGKYQVIKPIGSGSFGVIYEGLNLLYGQKVAIKFESLKAPCPQLMHEARVYKELKAQPSGMPIIYHHAKHGQFYCIVMELLGATLEDLFNKCQRRFSLKTVLMLGDQMLSRIEAVHQHGYIHRDIKPDNFLMGREQNRKKLFIVDFGLAKRIIMKGSKKHIDYSIENDMTGTVRYSSINAHRGIEQSRRDDLEALAHCLIYFNLGKLPWQGITCEIEEQKFEKILELKMSTPIQMLCKGYPAEFAVFLSYCRNLGFTEQPDYNYIHQLFRILMHNLGFKYDHVYDWSA